MNVTDHWDPDEAYLLLRALLSLTLALANFYDIDEEQLATLIQKASDAQVDCEGALTDEADGIDEGVVAALNSLGYRW